MATETKQAKQQPAAQGACSCGGVSGERWRAEVKGRLDADARYAALSAAFKKIVKRWRDEMDELLETP